MLWFIFYAWPGEGGVVRDIFVLDLRCTAGWALIMGRGVARHGIDMSQVFLGELLVVGASDQGVLQQHRNAAQMVKFETCMSIDTVPSFVQEGDKKQANGARKCMVRTVSAAFSDMPGSRVIFSIGLRTHQKCLPIFSMQEPLEGVRRARYELQLCRVWSRALYLPGEEGTSPRHTVILRSGPAYTPLTDLWKDMEGLS